MNEGIPLSTQSNEAAKLYDASVTQYIGWYDDVNFNGLGASLEKMIEEDPNFSELSNTFLELLSKIKNKMYFSRWKSTQIRFRVNFNR